MPDDIAQQLSRLNDVVKRLPELVTYIKPLKDSHEGLRQELADILGESGLLIDLRGQINMADKMVDDYISWMKDLIRRISDVATQIQQAGNSF